MSDDGVPKNLIEPDPMKTPEKQISEEMPRTGLSNLCAAFLLGARFSSGMSCEALKNKVDCMVRHTWCAM